jgi:tRNA-Thr(GGU) m(6)t(6)A37 methyltransferase TsaA
MQAITMNPIAIVHTEAKDAQDTDWSKVISEIHIDEALLAGLQGLDDWSHIVVIFSMHENKFEPSAHLLSRPRNRDDMPEVGTFAQRSRFTPNTIGITAVQLLEISGTIIRVKGLDAIDGTPVLDIKPYAPFYDGVRDPLVPAWFIRLMQR